MQFLGREYNLLSYNFTYIAYGNKDGTNLKVILAQEQ